MSVEKSSTAPDTDAPMSEAPSGGGVGGGVLAPRCSAQEVMGWSAEQEEFLIPELNFVIKNSVKTGLAEAFKAGTVGGQPVTQTSCETSGDSDRVYGAARARTLPNLRMPPALSACAAALLLSAARKVQISCLLPSFFLPSSFFVGRVFSYTAEEEEFRRKH